MILVTGATGNVGRHVVDGLLAAGEQVRDTVEKVTGRPARTFRQWARDHAADFDATVD
jgi:uncharacterized protein YbjT (DUF2867 family)